VHSANLRQTNECNSREQGAFRLNLGMTLMPARINSAREYVVLTISAFCRQTSIQGQLKGLARFSLHL
jgi:hypothetical protein